MLSKGYIVIDNNVVEMIDDYALGYSDGLHQTRNRTTASFDYIRGFTDALYDLLDATDYIDF